jgi:hypothetical protein
MNKYKTLTPLEIHQIGLDALTKELGLSGMIQFIKFFDKGSGNYTKERAKLLKEETVDELVSNIYKSRTNK